jgi:hypothetical protein
MVSAIAFTCAELIGSGSVATAASIASSMLLMVSGGKLAFEKSFIASVPVVNINSRNQQNSEAIYQLLWSEIVPW